MNRDTINVHTTIRRALNDQDTPESRRDAALALFQDNQHLALFEEHMQTFVEIHCDQLAAAVYRARYYEDNELVQKHSAQAIGMLVLKALNEDANSLIQDVVDEWGIKDPRAGAA